jgi:cysteinyl-tRNA synthetase
VLGLLQRSPEEFLQGASAAGALAPDQIEALIAERAAAKTTRNFAEADRIRKELLDNGVVLEDTPQGTIWRSA